MRILIFIAGLLTGLGLIAYSYIGAFMALIGEVEQDLYGETPITAVDRILSFINSGEAPQLMSFLYAGAFVLAAAVVYLIFGGRRKSHDE